jgi:hypothetical protein
MYHLAKGLYRLATSKEGMAIPRPPLLKRRLW